jgi:hypothetical protein
MATLTLADGDRLTVKRELNAGEQRAVHARLYVEGKDGKLRVDPLATGMALITAYLLDWTLTDEDGPVDIRGLNPDELAAILNRLHPTAFTDIKEAIEQHEQVIALERLEKKTSPATANASDRTSSSAN